MYFIELAINDQCEWVQIASRAKKVDTDSSLLFNLILSLGTHPAVVSVELFRSGYKGASDAKRHCGDHMLSFGPDVAFCEQWYMPQDWRAKARDRFRVPMVSYRDAVFPNLQDPPADLNVTWDGLSHPGPHVHFWVAEAIFFGLLSIRENLAESYVPPELKGSQCIHKKTSYYAYLGEEHFPVKSHGCAWWFGEDVREKPGWIIDGTHLPKGCDMKKDASREITFEVEAAKLGLVQISFLTSYDIRMGVARIWIPGTNVERRLHAKSKWHYSVPAPARFRLPNNKRSGKVEVKLRTFREYGPKFKILSLSTC